MAFVAGHRVTLIGEAISAGQHGVVGASWDDSFSVMLDGPTILAAVESITVARAVAGQGMVSGQRATVIGEAIQSGVLRDYFPRQNAWSVLLNGATVRVPIDCLRKHHGRNDSSSEGSSGPSTAGANMMLRNLSIMTGAFYPPQRVLVVEPSQMAGLRGTIAGQVEGLNAHRVLLDDCDEVTIITTDNLRRL